MGPSGMALIRKGLSERGNLAHGVVETILASWAPGSREAYDSKWRVFREWCRVRSIDPLQPDASLLLNFLQSRFEDGLQHSTIRGYCSAIGAIWKYACNSGVGEDNLIGKFLAGIAKQRPAAPKYDTFPDLSPLLEYLLHLDKTRRVDARCKAIVLLKIVTLARSADMARWLASSVQFMDSGELHLVMAQAKNIQEQQTKLVVRPLESNKDLCPVEAFRDYWKLLGGASTATFVWRSVVHPFESVSADTISRVTRRAMEDAGMDVEKFQANALRGAAVARAVDSGFCSPEDLRQQGHWKSAQVFYTFYLRSRSGADLTRALLER